MTRRSARVHITIASILVLLLVAMAAVPTTAASPKRRTGAEIVTFRLVNCIRTGGYVTRSGKCNARGRGNWIFDWEGDRITVVVQPRMEANSPEVVIQGLVRKRADHWCITLFLVNEQQEPEKRKDTGAVRQRPHPSGTDMRRLKALMPDASKASAL